MDYVTKAYAYDGTVRIFVATTTDLVNEAQKFHHLWPTATAALGRTLSIAAIMGLTYKDDVELTIRINGGGPIGDIIVVTNNLGEVRGYVGNPEVHFEYNSGPNKGKLNVGMAVGNNGFLHVTKDLKLSRQFTSSAQLQTGEIAEDFTYYFAMSEQIPSSVGAGILVDTDNSCIVGGSFLIQVMPGVKPETLDTLEKIIQNLEPVTNLLPKHSHEEIIAILSNQSYEILETHPVKYHCPCSRDRFKKGLETLDYQTLTDIIDEDGQAETRCHFCNTKYLFTKEELINIRNTKKKKNCDD